MKKWMKGSLIAVCLLFASLIPAQEVKKIYLFPGGLKTSPGVAITARDLAPVEPEGKFFSESWTFVYYTDDGGGGYIQFSSARIGYAVRSIGAP